MLTTVDIGLSSLRIFLVEKKMRNSVVYLVVFDGYSDLDAAQAISRVQKRGQSVIKVISASLDPVTSHGGIRVLPDIDFIESDLKDIDEGNTALLILPGGSAWGQRGNAFFEPLILHCMETRIPVLAMSEAAAHFAALEVMDRCGRNVCMVETTANGRTIKEFVC